MKLKEKYISINSREALCLFAFSSVLICRPYSKRFSSFKDKKVIPIEPCKVRELCDKNGRIRIEYSCGFSRDYSLYSIDTINKKKHQIAKEISKTIPRFRCVVSNVYHKNVEEITGQEALRMGFGIELRNETEEEIEQSALKSFFSNYRNAISDNVFSIIELKVIKE